MLRKPGAQRKVRFLKKLSLECRERTQPSLRISVHVPLSVVHQLRPSSSPSRFQESRGRLTSARALPLTTTFQVD